MSHNKSIDGLATHDAKISASRKATTKKFQTVDSTTLFTPTKPVKKSPETPDPTPKPTPKPKTTKKSPDASADFLSPIQAFDFDENSGELTKSKTPIKDLKQETKKDQPPKKVKKPSKTRRIISIIALVIVMAAIAFVASFIIWGNDIIAKINGGSIFDLLTFVDETYEPLKTNSNGRTNILAFGTEGYDMDGTVGGGTHAGSQLTDSIMMISLNQDTGDIAMLSLPRDLKASPTCTATGKINEVYWCNNQSGNDEEAGATALMTEVGSILGVDFQYYVHINWGSLVTIVDTLGGINVTLDEDINDYYFTHAVYEAGITYTINGEQALGLARARHGTTGGDFTRGASQQKIIIGIKDKIFEKDLSITDILSLASALGDNLRTNLSLSELKTTAHLTFNFDFNNMRQLSLYPDYMTTSNINSISYVIPRAGVGNYSAIQKYVTTMLSNDPRVYEEPTIVILNATEEAGRAASERNTLTDAGYKITDIDNTTGDFTENITLYNITNSAPGTVKILEDYYHITAHTSENLPENLPTDYDIIIVIGPTPVENEE